MEAVVYLRDLIPLSPLEPAEISEEERGRFIREVEEEVKRRYGEADELTRRSTLLTAQDYATTVNY